jgi:hypothetical protein
MVKRVGALTTRLLLSNSHFLSARVVPICPELRALLTEAEAPREKVLARVVADLTSPATQIPEWSSRAGEVPRRHP